MIDWNYLAREKEPVTACNLCGSTDLAELSETDRYGYPQPLRMCRRCGLGFLSPRLTAAEYGRFYEDVYRPLVSAYHGRRIDAETVQDDVRAASREARGDAKADARSGAGDECGLAFEHGISPC